MMMHASPLLAALAHTSSAFAPPTRPLHVTKPQRQTTVQALPSLPGWVPSLPAGTGQVAGDLSLFTVKTLIAWGVPAFVVALVVFPLADAIFGGDDEDRKSQLEGGAFGDEFALEDEQPQPPGLPFGRKKPRRAPNRPKAPQYLKVERLNERLESFEFSLESASSGRYAARKARRNRRLGKAFGDELGLAGLSDDGPRPVFFCLQRVAATASRRVRHRRDAPRRPSTPSPMRKETTSRKVLKLGRTCSSRGRRSGASRRRRTRPRPRTRQQSSKKAAWGPRSRSSCPSAARPKSNRDDALNALAEATKEQQVAELDYLGVVASHLPDDVARRRLGQLASEGRDGTLEGSLSDALSFLRNSTEAKRAYVLQFDGDPAASQTANLREEVTAVLKTADASRGDEVVLKLTTGGGTVTGYGLAAAQLLRLKDAGLKLTVCVEQVAASGGYMMACCGDRIIASPFAVLGSIGVITDIPNAYERLKQEGIEFQTVTAGRFQAYCNPYEKSDQGRPREDRGRHQGDLFIVQKICEGATAISGH